ncbi:MAG TPA: hypothetical protein VGH67_22620 [Solirubrobacteraceae bacterium]|jgi:hypothetical protein
MLQGLFSRHTRLVGAVVSVLGIAVLSGAPARAALINTDACDSTALTQPFSPWGDANDYKLVAGGSFESGASGWTLSHGASIVKGSEPYGAAGSVGASSANLPAGASVTSPFTCVDAAYPTFRFFGRNDGLLSTVLVSVVYRLPLLGQVAVPVGPVALSGTWHPSLPMLTASVLTGLLNGGTTQMAIRFTALTGDSQIDDVFVDPHMHY